MKGKLTLIAVVPSGLLVAAAVNRSNHSFSDEQGWFGTMTIFTVLFTAWLFVAGWQLAAGATRAFRFTGIFAIATGLFGVVLFIQGYESRAVDIPAFAAFALPLALGAVIAGIGHLRLAKGDERSARILHRVAWLSAPGAVASAFLRSLSPH